MHLIAQIVFWVLIAYFLEDKWKELIEAIKGRP